MPHKFFRIALLAALWGCSNDPEQVGAPNGGGSSGLPPGGIRLDAGPGGGKGGSSTGDARDPAGTNAGELMMLVRDFKFYDLGDQTTNPDFENTPKADASGNPSTTYFGPWDDKGLVSKTLGQDSKPQYAGGATGTLTTHGPSAFDQWYRTIDKVNIAQQIPLTLKRDSRGNFAYDSRTAGPPLSPGGGFFPIDDRTPYATRFGNQGQSHNYSFTVEIHTVFVYRGGEIFKFSGDDDVFVFINNQLVIDLGGIHAREEFEVALDTLGLTKGETYPLDFFSAERHVSQSNMLITTTLELAPNPDIPIY